MNENLRSCFSTLLTVVVLCGAVSALPRAVKLRATPQKFRTFYANDDSRIPSSIRARLAKSQREAQVKGVVWRVEVEAIVRLIPTKLRLSFAEGLPVGKLRAIAVTNDGAVWVGGSQGVVRFAQASRVWERWQYFAGLRYLPSDEVLSLAPGEDNSIWIRTAKGVSHIEFRPMTLAEKASYFEQRIEQRHKRHGLVSDSEFAEA